MKRLLLTTALALTCGLASAQNALQSGDRLAICGDSITQYKIYSVYIEDYLLMCQPAPALQAMQFGLGGETSPKFLIRMQGDVLPFKPSVATLFYGMNDGGYVESDPAKLDAYRKAMTDVVKALKGNGTRFIVVGSPGVVDTTTFRRNDPAVYNKTLADLGAIAKEVAAQQGAVFADVHAVMETAMQQTKAKYGPTYRFAGPDGIHPEANGHIAIAYAFLKALGCSGEIGTITVDLRGNTATGTDGQKIVSMQNGSVAVESMRYPFCFHGDPSKPDSTRGTIEFIPFNQDLNRYLLVVKNATASKLNITWGAQSKVFSSADLEKGINLAVEFPDNPFSAPFAKVEAAILHQQTFESSLPGMLRSVTDWGSQFPDQQTTFDQMRQSVLGMDDSMKKASATAVAPVSHTIKIEPAP